ncbi:MAG: adenylate/guanylate cyclase domain-containing protein, partial [Omnitrophica WOR_2 bacterium]
MSRNKTPDEWWHDLLTGDNPVMPLRQVRRMFSLMSGHVRCKFCNAPFDGEWASLVRFIGRGPSRLTSQLCQQCQVVATKHLGGAEIELTLLFADVRGSTKLGEQMKPAEFSQLISHFFSASSHVLLDTHAWVDRLVGDQVIGMYIPYFAGQHPELAAIEAARNLLHATGHDDRLGPWIEVGVGVHSGTAYIGTVGSAEGATDITVLGDVPNAAARLSSAARTGEILISEDAYTKAGLSQ